MNRSLRQAVLESSHRADAHDAIATVYADLQAEIDQRRPLCTLSGRCCRFEQVGHRLYVTTLELATFLHQAANQRPPLDLSGQMQSWNGIGCPFQMDNRCGVHPIRPLGCRIYFCDPQTSLWQSEMYEQLHARLRLLHDRVDVSYRYLEWRAALRELFT